jgi:hypothetical protein
MENRETNRRDDFLLAMYNQMWGNIDRHILVIWQSVGALLGAFAVLALIEKNVLPVDLACSIMVVICAWVAAHVIDANYWFTRNLVIIINIERQFLLSKDLQDIHPYFRDHRRPTLDHLVVQAWLAASVFFLIAGWHFFTRVAPGFASPWGNFEFSRALPYVVALIAAVLLFSFKRKQKKSYERLLHDSPGISLEPELKHRTATPAVHGP